MEIKISNGTIKATASKAIPTIKWNREINSYRITLKSSNGKTRSFMFYDSIANRHLTKLDDEGIKGAMRCICFDALTFDNNRGVGAFYREFGYDEYAEGRKAYNACERMYNRLTDLGFTIDDIVKGSED